MMGLAVGLAILGSVFFWRDVRRDLETAELRSLFVASVSHELKTPLAAIRMFAETLRLKRFREPEKETEYLDTIVNESQRLDRLIANVLDFSKIEKSRRIYRFENTSIKDVLESAVRVMDYPLRSKGFQLKLAIRDELPEISADADALLQAVLNLLDNAMKYSGDSREIELSLIRDELKAIIRIRDWGIGIPASEHQRIFEKFQRVPDRKSEGVVGAGLGLALAEHIVEAHGGRIEVESRPGEGSVFSLILPLENRV
jgi:two-component system phosphate regulon sensor histidine kinase PhoR